MSQPAAAVLHKYKQLLRLIRRLPPKDSEAALREARDKMRAGALERNPEARLARMKELSARLGYLRIVTPRTPGEVEAQAGTFLLNKEGELVESAGAGAVPGRVAGSVISMDEAMRLNKQHFKRFYGADKPAPGTTFF